MIKFTELIKGRFLKEEKKEIQQIQASVKRGVFKVDDKLIAGAYYSDDEIKAIATDIGCVKLNKEPKLVEDINLNTATIETNLIRLKRKTIEDFIFIKELC